MARNERGETPLHVAVNESAQVIEALVAAGADVAARDIDGDTPLHGWNRFGDPAG